MTACGHAFSVLQRRVSARLKEKHHDVGVATHCGEHERGATECGSGIHIRIVSKQDRHDLRTSVEAGPVKGHPTGLLGGVGIGAGLEQALSFCGIPALRRVTKRLFRQLRAKSTGSR